jgi:hypothetical protein
VTIPPTKSVQSPSRPKGGLRVRGGGLLGELQALEKLVHDENACALPGSTIKYHSFMTCLRRAVSRGYVKDVHAEFVEDGLTNGFSIGLARASLKGRRVFKNYPSAYVAVDSVTDAIRARVAAARTCCLGVWSDVKVELDELHDDYFVFPMGAVPKPHQPEVMRPTSDHTRTGLNAQTVVSLLRHSLDTYNEISWFLKKDYFMRVSDVADAFMLIPLAPWLWPFFLFRWYSLDNGVDVCCYAHLFGDFGTRGLPGTFKIFLVDVVVQMARSELVLTLPLAIYVDDSGMIGPDEDQVNSEAVTFHDWSELVCGVAWKVLKERPGARLQFMIGFWWNSTDLTRALDVERRVKYVEQFDAAGHATVLTLRERQKLAGWGQRAVLTFPPGASCLLTTCYIQLRGLKLLWHSRRTTRAERLDYHFIRDLLKLNLGKGYYSYADHTVAPTVLSDASDSRKYSGGGWVSACGAYDWFVYKGRQAIDWKEGDSVLRACETMGPLWRGCIVPFGIDNTVIERSVAKGRSGVERLNELMKHLFILQVKYGFILAPFRISSADNYLADALSRDGEDMFLSLVHVDEFLSDTARPIRRMPDAGRVVHIDRPGSMSALRQLLVTCSSNNLRDGPVSGVGVGGDAQLLSIGYTPSSIYTGLPIELMARMEELLDNRLAPSSRAHVDSAARRWSAFCAEHGWDPLLADDDVGRGGKMSAWILSMVDESELVFKSIVNYIWGMRTWHTLQGRSDPAMGVRGWRELMRATAVMTTVPAEPRAMVPLETLKQVLAVLATSERFSDKQLHLVVLVLLFTFSRTECPCPKAWTGPNAFDSNQHWQVADFKLRPSADGGKSWVLWVRFKRIKQDARVERASMVHADTFVPAELTGDGGFGRDWVPLGDVPTVDEACGLPIFSVAAAYKRFVKAVGRARSGDEPMFLNKDKSRYYTYSCLLADFHEAFAEFLISYSKSLGPHGLRVLGYNLSKAGNGEDLTVAHGGWMSSAHSRYHRWGLPDVLNVPARMLGVDAPFAAARPVTRVRARRGSSAGTPVTSREDLSLEGLLSSDDEDEPGVPTVHARALPAGYTRENITRPNGRPDFVVHAPNGSTCRSIAEAWRHAAAAPAAVAPSPAPTPSPSRRQRAVPRSSSVGRPRPSVSFVLPSPPQSQATTPAAAGPHSEHSLPLPVSMQGLDLSEAVVEKDRPPLRRAPMRR